MLFGKYVNKYYLRYIHLFLLGIAALLLVDVAQLKVPELFGGLIDAIKFGTLTIETLHSVVKTLLIIAAIMFVCRFTWRMCLFSVGVKIEADVRLVMFKKLQTLSQDYFSDNKTGATLALFTNDLQTIRRCMGQGTLMFVDAFFLGILVFIKMYRLQHTMSFIAVVPLILLGLIGMFYLKHVNRQFMVKQKAFEDLSDFTQENFSGLNVIKAFVKEHNEKRRFLKVNKYNEDVNVNFTKLMTKIQIGMEFTAYFIAFIVLAVGAYIIIYHQNLGFTIGSLTEYISYISTLFWPVMALAQFVNLSAQGYASLKRITKLLNEQPSVKDQENSVHIDHMKGKIEFRNLTFKYPDNPNEILSNISFTINPGEKIGVVGKTGSGKSTFIDLLLRMYNVDKGTIFIDDHDIMDLSLESIRQNISFVPQDNFLFGTKVKYNIAFGTKATDEEIITAAKMADVHKDIIEFADGYDTELGERGVTVSGGQKQRISIARALMKKAPILVLDDAVSAVDTKTEDIILRNLRENFNDSTIILTAHRISTVQDLDRILVLDEGKVVGFGTNNDLYNTCPLYKEMVDLQKLESKIEGETNGEN